MIFLKQILIILLLILRKTYVHLVNTCTVLVTKNFQIVPVYFNRKKVKLILN